MVDARKVYLIGTNGIRLDLNTADRFVVGDSPALWGAPPVEIVEQPVLGAPGAQLAGAPRHLPRDALLPITVMGDTPLECDQRQEQLIDMIDASGGAVRIVVERGDGSSRELVCHTATGQELASYRKAGSRHVTFPLRFRALDPYWRSTTESEYDVIAQVFSGGGEPTAWDASEVWDAPIPWDGYNAAGVQRFFVDIAGVPTFPRWEVTGPGEELAARNWTVVGALWEYTPTIRTDSRFVMHTDPRSARVSVDDVNAMPGLSDASELWPLVKGRNWIALRLQSWVPGRSQIRLSWRERFLTC